MNKRDEVARIVAALPKDGPLSRYDLDGAVDAIFETLDLDREGERGVARTARAANDKPMARFNVRGASEAAGARIDIFERFGARRVRLANFDGCYVALATLSDLRTALDDANAFGAALDGPRAPEAAGGRGL